METKQHENGIIEIISDEILIRQPGDFSEIFPEMFVSVRVFRGNTQKRKHSA
jgi:hypothetical protein